jgi:hypothetical protein
VDLIGGSFDGKLTAEKTPVDVLVIDHVEEHSEN